MTFSGFPPICGSVIPCASPKGPLAVETVALSVLSATDWGAGAEAVGVIAEAEELSCLEQAISASEIKATNSNFFNMRLSFGL